MLITLNDSNVTLNTSAMSSVSIIRVFDVFLVHLVSRDVSDRGILSRGDLLDLGSKMHWAFGRGIVYNIHLSAD